MYNYNYLKTQILILLVIFDYFSNLLTFLSWFNKTIYPYVLFYVGLRLQYWFRLNCLHLQQRHIDRPLKLIPGIEMYSRLRFQCRTGIPVWSQTRGLDHRPDLLSTIKFTKCDRYQVLLRLFLIDTEQFSSSIRLVWGVGEL